MTEEKQPELTNAAKIRKYTKESADSFMKEYIRGMNAGAKAILQALMFDVFQNEPGKTLKGENLPEVAKRAIENFQNALEKHYVSLQKTSETTAEQMIAEIEEGK